MQVGAPIAIIETGEPEEVPAPKPAQISRSLKQQL